jgi:pimeloyl-ACP methyl ester carboxylesterase
MQTELPVAEIIGRYLDVLGYRTYYESVGTGPAVVSIHSGGADSREYRHLLPELGRLGWHAIALDMPGHGKSYPNLDNLRPIDTAAHWVEFVLAFSRAIELDRPVYLGAAMSASVLLRLAAEHPDASRGIVAAGGTADFTGWLSEEYLDVLNHPLVNAADFMESTTPGLFGPHLAMAIQNECIWHNARSITPEVMEADLRIYATHDISGILDLIAVPVLHLRGEFDRTVNDENVAAIRAGIANVTMEALPGVGHYSMLEDPELFNRSVARFLTRILK